MKLRHVAALGSILFAGAALATAPTAAAAGEHCQQQGYCLFSGTNFTGTQVSVPSAGGCHTVSSLGIQTARSAARGFGDGLALELYSDSNCATSVGDVFSDLPDVTANSYRVIPIPG